MAGSAVPSNETVVAGPPPVDGSTTDRPDWLAARRERLSPSATAPSIPAPSEVIGKSPASIDVPTFSRPQIKPRNLRVKLELPSNAATQPEQPFWRLSRRSMIGIGVSLLIHSVALGMLAFIWVTRAASPSDLRIWGVVGETEEIVGDFLLDTALPIDAGESAPIEITDFSHALDSNGQGTALSESLRVGMGGKGRGDGDAGDGASIGAPSMNIPGHAQTKGSFSAWPDPRHPRPGEDYFIVIQVKLPSRVKKFRGSDISGLVVGTDNYRQTIRYRSSEQFPVENGAVQIRIRVPGAPQLVRDTVRVESKMLHEKQTFEIVFGNSK